MRTFIYSGGVIHPDLITERPAEGELCIAADGGYRNAQSMGGRVDVLIGDLDSLGGRPPEGTENMELIRLPEEKDCTDTQAAVSLALERGADELLLIGSLGGRLDHALSTLSVLEDLWERGISAIITDGQNRARFLCSDTVEIPRSEFSYLSVVAADREVEGVTVTGCKYPLQDATLRRRVQFAVSNEIVQDRATVSVRRGGVYIIESRDL